MYNRYIICINALVSSVNTPPHGMDPPGLGRGLGFQH